MSARLSHYGNLLPLKRSVPHATRGRDGRQEGRERGYYYLHRNLDDSLLHNFRCFF